jgi:uncharacterized protein (DUF302 family)/uncharacterized membrane protein YidH (DUF202 family)
MFRTTIARDLEFVHQGFFSLALRHAGRSPAGSHRIPRLLHHSGMSGGPSDYLAAERNFLAWIRTGIALMGFGFVVARFGVFLRMLQTGASAAQPENFGFSFWVGTVLIVVGVFVNVWSVRNHLRLIADLSNGGSAWKQPSRLAIAVALSLAAIGAAMAIYLVSIGQPKQTLPQKALHEKIMKPEQDNGLITIPSSHSVDETVAKLQTILENKGVKLFALVDHSGEAKKAGLKMPNTKVLIFGNPKAGTSLMLAAPSAAIDLPLKILVAEDTGGQVTLTWNSPAWLEVRHGFPVNLIQHLAVVENLARTAAN